MWHRLRNTGVALLSLYFGLFMVSASIAQPERSGGGAPRPVKEWSDEKAWWMDLMKSSISFLIGAGVTLLGIERITARRARRRLQDDIVFQLGFEALTEFRQASIAYELAALAAFTDLYKWQGKDKTDAMHYYERDAQRELRVAVDGVRRRFAEESDALYVLDEFEQKLEKRHKSIYDALVDTRLDGLAQTPIDPGKHRADFNEIGKQVAKLRADLITRMEEVLIHTPRK